MTSLRLAAADNNVPPSVPHVRVPSSDANVGDPHSIPANANGWALYRDRTVALLRRYLRLSLDLGRTPSLLGGQMFRARVTAYRAHTFEDVVIFVHDMEQCLRRLDPLSRILIAKIVLAEYTSDEVAGQLRTTRRQINRRLELALDQTSEMLVTSDLMFSMHADRLPPKNRPVRVDHDSWWPDRTH